MCCSGLLLVSLTSSMCETPKRLAGREGNKNSSNVHFCICHIAEERHTVHLIEKRWADLPIYSFYLLDDHDYMTHFGINILMQTGVIYWWSLFGLIFSRFKSSLEVKYSAWLRVGISSLDILQPLQMYCVKLCFWADIRSAEPVSKLCIQEVLNLWKLWDF